jgi:hypothetical protein
MIYECELEWILKEEVVAYCKYPSNIYRGNE